MDTPNKNYPTEIKLPESSKVEDDKQTPVPPEVDHKVDDGKETKPINGEPPKDDTKKIELSDVTIRDDGIFEWKVSPDDPESTIYTGKDMNELLSNIRKGVHDKDSYIGKLKKEIVEKTLKVPEAINDTDGQPDVLEPPDLQTFRENAYKAANSQILSEGLNTEMLFWTEKQWDDYQETNTFKDRYIMQLQNKAENLRNKIENFAHKEYSGENVKFLNSSVMMNEHETVTEYLKDQDVLDGKFTPAQYEAIIKEVRSKPENFDRAGILKPGRILLAVQRVVSKITTNSIENRLKKDLEKTIVESDSIKAKIPSVQTGVKQPETKQPPPKNYDEAAKRLAIEVKKARGG